MRLQANLGMTIGALYMHASGISASEHESAPVEPIPIRLISQQRVAINTNEALAAASEACSSTTQRKSLVNY
jgi:hypothetical protein